ncbi:hypothetical protein SCHPADRAFT_342106 [Schizopora paradoxa]|uniref:Uncharacterized protein n=1 Tax=Schizopora paradoxa TaxID=27342 RepID=A0A0H2RP93_9AGAM|nr:hypothetical protein SCHPADRAFT_342106 [Schizopora paradoxa]
MPKYWPTAIAGFRWIYCTEEYKAYSRSNQLLVNMSYNTSSSNTGSSSNQTSNNNSQHKASRIASQTSKPYKCKNCGKGDVAAASEQCMVCTKNPHQYKNL